MNKDTVEQLAKLYHDREALQKARDTADKNFWLGVINDAFRSERRIEVLEAVGGAGSFAAILGQTVVEVIESFQLDLDRQIIDLGGEP